MSEMRVIKYSERRYGHPTVLIGFPSVGLVGPIVAGFMARTLKMDTLAGITSCDIPPYALIQGGIPLPQIRIYGYESMDEDGMDLVIVTSEIAPRPEQCSDLAITIIDFLKDINAGMIIAIEGIPKYEGDSILACGSSEKANATIRDMGVQPLDEGLVRGMTGIMLYEASYRKMDVIAMLCPANPALPDPRAAASVLEPLSKIIHGLDLDTGPLYKEAEDIDNRIKAQEAQNSIDTQRIYG
jgi:uncharacterized protein